MMTKKELEAKIKELEARISLLEFQREMDRTPPWVEEPTIPYVPAQPYDTGTLPWFPETTTAHRGPGVYGGRNGNTPVVIVEA